MSTRPIPHGSAMEVRYSDLVHVVILLQRWGISPGGPGLFGRGVCGG
ncbi:MAG: hypothetical protein IPH53_04435 [Flavobacteriales bacterium]|nr:hypothetical protein [Flavobacteriales bacterium]